MSKQMDINDLIPDEIKDDTRRFIDAQFNGQVAEAALPMVRNRHEGYGLLAEAYLGVNGAMDGVKAAMRDCLKALSGNDGNFQDAASNAFNSLLDTCIAAVHMGVQALNVIYSIDGLRRMNPTPMEELAAEMTETVMNAEDADELPDVETDGE